MTVETIQQAVLTAAEEFHIRKVTLFGSRAAGTNREDSDVDLIVEFSCPVSLLTLSSLKCTLEELLGRSVDVIHGPLRADDLLEVGKVVELYAA